MKFKIIILLFMVKMVLTGVTKIKNHRKQSPIKLDRKKAIFNVPPIIFNNYDILMDLYGENNGYTTIFTIPDKYQSEITVENKLIPGKFKAINFHFHWGRKDNQGAEHIIENKKYSMELHIVHMNTKYTVAQALQNKDGYLVIGILYKASTDLKSSFNDEISNKVNELITYKNKTEIKNFTLNTFIKNVYKDNFLLYEGSFTTTPYSEVVTWIVFTDIQTVGSNELQIYRKLQKSDGKLILQNYRKVQPINGRVILKREL